jgi:hypothetical protein
MSGEPVRDVPPAPVPEAPGSRYEIPLAASLSALFFVLFLSLPLAGAAGLPLASVPLVRVAHRRGLPSGLLAAAIACAILFGVALASGSVSGAVALGGLAFAATALPVVFAGRTRRGADPSLAFLGLVASGALLLSGALLALPLAGQPPMGTEVRAAFNAMIPAALESYRKSGADAATIEKVRGTLILARDFTTRYWVGLIGAGWVLGAAIGFYAGARTARPAPSAEASRFEGLRIPAGVAVLFVAAGAAFALLSDASRTAAGDVLLFLAALYFVAGLSIICHFARRWFRARILRFGLYVLVAYFPMNLGVALLGLFDWYANFRRRGEKGESGKR